MPGEDMDRHSSCFTSFFTINKYLFRLNPLVQKFIKKLSSLNNYSLIHTDLELKPLTSHHIHKAHNLPTLPLYVAVTHTIHQPYHMDICF